MPPGIAVMPSAGIDGASALVNTSQTNTGQAPSCVAAADCHGTCLQPKPLTGLKGGRDSEVSRSLDSRRSCASASVWRNARSNLRLRSAVSAPSDATPV